MTFIAHPVAIERIARASRVPVPEVAVADRLELEMGGTRIDILDIGRGHTGSDLVVHLPQENILFMGELFFNRIYPSVGGGRTAYPSEWIATVRRAEAMQADIYVPGHGFIDSSDVLAEELVSFRLALENLVGEATRLHDEGMPVESAFRVINLGRFQYWYRAANNMPDAVRQVYREIDGELP